MFCEMQQQQPVPQYSLVPHGTAFILYRGKDAMHRGENLGVLDASEETRRLVLAALNGTVRGRA